MLKCVNTGFLKSFCYKRLVFFEKKFDLHMMYNKDVEMVDTKLVPHKDFYNIRKIDTHVHHSACMNSKHLSNFIKKKLKEEP